MSQRARAVACLIAAAIMWSSGGVLIKWVQWHPLAIAGTRSAIAALTLLVFLRRPRFTGSVAQIGGAVAYAATVLLYVVAVKMTTAANAILLQYTAPIWVALFSAWFLSEKVRRLDWAAVSLSIVGMTLFFREGLASASLVGDLLALLSGVTIAWMTLFLRKQKDGSPLESVLLGNILAALFGLPFIVSGPLPDAQGWLGLLLLGVLQLGISYVLYSAAIRHVTAFDAILFSTLEPLLNPVWVLLLLGERPGIWALVGGALVVLAITGRGLIVTASTARRASHDMRSAASPTAEGSTPPARS